MAWQGEQQIGKYFGLRGFKCIMIMMKEEINKLRVKAGLPEYTWEQILNRMDVLMETYKEDDKGVSPITGV